MKWPAERLFGPKELWKEQFPLAAARREYYGLNCTEPAALRLSATESPKKD